MKLDSEQREGNFKQTEQLEYQLRYLKKAAHIELAEQQPNYKNKMWTDEQSEWPPKYTEQDAEQTEQAEQQPNYKIKMWTDAQSEWSPKYTEQDAEQTEQAEQQPKYAKQDAD